MKRDLIWRLVESRLRARVPATHVSSTLGDLAEDYARRRAAAGPMRAGFWLLREARSLSREYSAAAPRSAVVHVEDLRHAWRRLRARPGASMLCAALLALGIGLATAMFSVVDSILLQPAPFPDADRLVRHGLPGPAPQTTAVIEAWRASGVLDAVEAAGADRPLMLDGTREETNWTAASITPGLLPLLGAEPSRGRLFDAADVRAGSDVILLSEVVWRTAFGADASIVGRRIRIDGASRLVIGVLPSSFRFPRPTTMAWTPLEIASGPRSIITIVGRLRAGVPFADAEVRLRDLSFALSPLPSRRAAPPVTGLVVTGLDTFTRQALWLLFAGVALVFVVLCANAGSLLLTQLAARQREFGTCTALGASRARLMSQAAMEHAAIAAFGVALGIALAASLIAFVPTFFLDRTLNPIDVDVRALLAACALGAIGVVVTGIVPAWLGTRADPVGVLRAARDSTGGAQGPRATRALLVGEIALAGALLVGSGLLVRSFVNLAYADRGLRLDDVVQVNVAQIDRAFPSPDANAIGTAAIETQVSAWPEVAALALSRDVPPAWETGLVHLPQSVDASVWIKTDTYRVSPGFFDVYGVQILSGRRISRADSDAEVVIGQRLARLLWPDEDPLGRTLMIGRQAARRVVGIAREMRLPTLEDAIDRPELYVPMEWTSRTLYLHLRCLAACPDDATIGARIQAMHPVLRTRVHRAVDTTFEQQLQLPRAIAQVAGLFAGVAVIAAAGGLFSVLSAAVGRRRREFGIRTALGASPGQVRRLVFRDAMTLVAVGLMAGGAGGWLVARSLAAFQYGVTSIDPLTWTGVLAILALASVAAAWRPARDATRIDPVTLLREE